MPDFGAGAAVGSPEGRPILEPGALRPEGRGKLMELSCCHTDCGPSLILKDLKESVTAVNGRPAEERINNC